MNKVIYYNSIDRVSRSWYPSFKLYTGGFMLTKRTRGNQITIPKEIVIKARLKETDEYFDIVYEHGIIMIKPVEIEDRIPPESYDKLIRKGLKKEPGDISSKSRRSDPLKIGR